MTTEMWLALLAILSSIAAGLTYMGKRRVDIALKESETELERVRNEASEFDQLMKLIHNQAGQFQMQLEINQATSSTIQKVSDANEQNYQVLKQVWDRHTQEIMENSRLTGQRVIAHVEKMPEQMAAVALEGLKQVTAELAVQMAEIMRQTVTRYEANVFPSLGDRRWVDAYVHPKNSVACLFDEPRFQEPARNLLPESCLKGEERCWVIEEVSPGFHAVRRTNGTYGFLLITSVLLVPIGNHFLKRHEETKSERDSSSGNVDSGGSGAAGIGGGGDGSPTVSGRGGSRSSARGGDTAGPGPGD